ncbi:MAG: bifunctional oligoribonuclease/PAP phosphatase NrnA [Bacteroidota bacterium]
MKDVQAIKTLLSSPKNIVITTHANPDGDALGSSLGLSLFLKKHDHKVNVITPTAYPDFLNWMKGNDEVIINGDSNQTEITKEIETADLIFCLDFNGLKRINDLGPLVGKSKAKKILIDHHLDPDGFADYSLWDTKSSATAELIYDLIEALEGLKDIDADIAECLYAGIMTDTGSFKHSSTTSKTHRIVASLIDAGADTNKVNRAIYDTNSLNRLRFIGYALMEKLVVLDKVKVGYFVITAEEHERFHLKSGDTEGLVNYALSIKGVEMAAIIMERNEEIKLSFRSVGDRAVNTFAAKYFDGGGHKNAAGGHSNKSLEETVKKFKRLIESQ